MNFNIKSIFEVHLSVFDRNRATQFYQDVLGFELAADIARRDVTFMWMGKRGSRMLGLWGPSCPNPPITRGKSHFAMELPVQDFAKVIQDLKARGVTPLDFDNNPTDEPIILAWMPAVSVYFNDPDGNSLEFIAMLDEEPNSELGVLKLSEWHGKK